MSGGEKSRASGGGGLRALRLIAGEPLPPLPRASDLLEAAIPRRPGELHEALPIRGPAAETVVAQAAQAGVTLEIAASLLIEAGLVAADLGARLPSPEPAASGLPLPEGYAVYLRSLTVGRRGRLYGRARATRAITAAVPARLVTRLAHTRIETLLAAVPLDVAISWEVAAVRAGRTMAEWALVQAVRYAR